MTSQRIFHRKSPTTTTHVTTVLQDADTHYNFHYKFEHFSCDNLEATSFQNPKVHGAKVTECSMFNAQLESWCGAGRGGAGRDGAGWGARPTSHSFRCDARRSRSDCSGVRHAYSVSRDVRTERRGEHDVKARPEPWEPDGKEGPAGLEGERRRDETPPLKEGKKTR